MACYVIVVTSKDPRDRATGPGAWPTSITGASTMTHHRGDQPAQPCICGSREHEPLRDQTFSPSSSGVGFLRCPERELPRYAARGYAEVARGICWALDPVTGLHCTEPPHDDDTDHRNGYAGQPWPSPQRQ